MRVLFQTGMQHMNGVAALEYARTRHDDNDFERGNRQQQVLKRATPAGRPARDDHQSADS